MLNRFFQSVGSISIKGKIVVMVIASVMIASVGLIAGSYIIGRDNAFVEASASLMAANNMRARNFQHYEKQVVDDLDYMAQNPGIQDNLMYLVEAWRDVAVNSGAAALQDAYIHNNPNPAGEKHLLDEADDDSWYSGVHAQMHPSLRTFLERRGYYDIFIISPAGDVVYTVYKELDFSTNVVDGEFADSGLGRAFRRANELGEGQWAFEDFSPYAPSNGAPAAFIAMPIVVKGEKQGVMAFQIPDDHLASAVIAEQDGIEMVSYLVGEDGLLRTDVAATSKNDVLTTRAELSSERKAGDGGVHIERHPGLIGADELLAVQPISFLGADWRLVSERPVADVLKTAEQQLWAMLTAMAPVVLVVAVLGWFFGRSMSRPILAMRDALDRLASGEAIEVPGSRRHDELGELARSMAVISERGLEAARIRGSLDSSSALMMLTDAEHNIVYYNKPLGALLKKVEPEIRRDLPHFDAGDLIGSNIDMFHSKPEHQRGMLTGLDGTQETRLTLGGRSIHLAISPVLDADGERIGTVVEWRDVTAEQRATDEIDAVVAAVLDGDFSRRAKLDGAPDVLRAMGERMNKVAETVEAGVSETSRVVSAMAAGDLTQRMTGDFHGAFADLRESVNAMSTRLSELVGEISGATQSVSGAAGQIVSGSEDLSARAEQQASSLEETAATMEEMSASIKSNAESSASATSLAVDASNRANSGGEIVDQAVSAMREIEESASRIADIIGVIDGIAFQTNLLALNAAVEAARAGDAGKGFAVVASEVRALAQRSSDAARDIRNLIQTSAGQVAEGVRLVSDTGSSLSGIVDSIRQVEEAIKSIAEASVEQATGVEEISSTVSHLDQMTQENSSAAEASAAQARTMAGSAEELRRLIAFFNVAGSARETAADAAWQAVAERPQPVKTAARAAAPSRSAALPKATPEGDWSSF